MTSSIFSWDPPQFHVYTVSMKPEEPYIALSYVWGNERDAKYIVYINDEAHAVSSNLYHFICYFRSFPGPARGNQALWIDQLCIDQSNRDERSETVRFMADIYREAAFVVSWLGIDPGMTAAALEFELHKSANALTTLLQNGYFTRLWVVQEVLLARKVHVMCGYTWLRMSHMEEWSRLHEKEMSGVRNSALYLLWDSVHNRFNRRLEQCIERYSFNGCTDPHDRVYALLGLVKKEEQIPVDYAKSVEEVFRDVFELISTRHYDRRELDGFPYETLRTLASHMYVSLEYAEALHSYAQDILEDIL
ncbi:HET-domain-containing protein [Plenodomus tracheiphilus IPT5]|uniref:HET-domain-containing protein n=1 Tax=Plenodomus tracheiphilus IPT5 TaxID=1408161 RepID=A0A6A7APA3_9PLEO|nr:HET-domain-containing protein [Plenodomus tracheiphilus IPT5]